MKSVVVRSKSVKKGDRFGRLEVIGDPFVVRQNGQRRVVAVCQCDCGSVICSRTDGFGRRVFSCGCLCKENTAKAAKSCLTTHGMSKHPLYLIRGSMLSRCTNQNHKDWNSYGGRGIAVCEDWTNSPVSFFNWAIENGWSKGLQIDRMDNDGNYEPANCRFVTGSRNCRNQRRSKMLTAFGETKCVADWAEDPRCVVNYSTLAQRVRKLKWSAEKAITLKKVVA